MTMLAFNLLVVNCSVDHSKAPTFAQVTPVLEKTKEQPPASEAGAVMDASMNVSAEAPKVDVTAKSEAVKPLETPAVTDAAAIIPAEAARAEAIVKSEEAKPLEPVAPKAAEAVPVKTSVSTSAVDQKVADGKVAQGPLATEMALVKPATTELSPKEFEELEDRALTVLQTCAMCHNYGNDQKPYFTYSPHLNEILTAYSKKAMFKLDNNLMPPPESDLKITAQERKDLRHYFEILNSRPVVAAPVQPSVGSSSF